MHKIIALREQIKQHSRVVMAIGVGLVVGGFGSAAVLAAIPDAGGVIHGCYSTRALTRGQLRVIDTAASPPQTCNANETAVNWNQQGPKGDTGAPGPAGPRGPAGSGQVISGILHVPFGGASNQVLLSMPNLGSYRVTECNESIATIMYVNDTNHDVYDQSLLIPPGGQRATVGYASRPGIFSYTSGGTTYLGTITQSAGGPGETDCYFQAQATMSQIN